MRNNDDDPRVVNSSRPAAAAGRRVGRLGRARVRRGQAAPQAGNQLDAGRPHPPGHEAGRLRVVPALPRGARREAAQRRRRRAWPAWRSSSWARPTSASACRS
ncbi:MAG: hypothetical protein WKG07_14295 [Hymenobacter sp.]